MKSERKKDIKVRFPEEKFKKYIQEFNTEDAKELTPEQRESVLKDSFGDFQQGTLSLDEFSSICGKLWWEVKSDDKFETKLAEVLYKGGELSFYVRAAQRNEETGLTFLQFLREVASYATTT